MSPRQQPEQQAPPVQRLRLRYAKTGRARFASHRDFSRAFERALRRAEVPMAYSSGFSPHPRISYANASPTGAATEAEYLEIGLADVRDAEEIRAALNAALPDGFAITAIVTAGAGSLADSLTVSAWDIQVVGVARELMDGAVAALLAAEAVPVQRMTKTGRRDFDARGAIIALSVRDDQTLRLLARHLVPLVRPDDVMTALGSVADGFRPTQTPLFHRLAQGDWADDRLVDPFTGEPVVLD